MHIFYDKRIIFFDKYMKIWEKVSNIIKKINIELIYDKTYLKAKKKINTKVLYTTNLLIEFIEKMKTII